MCGFVQDFESAAMFRASLAALVGFSKTFPGLAGFVVGIWCGGSSRLFSGVALRSAPDSCARDA